MTLTAALAMMLALSLTPATVSPAGTVRGERLATRLGCRSCHGEQLEGRVQIDEPQIATLYSSNLSRRVPNYDDAVLERVIRTGVRPDGSRLWMMAAAPYAVLSRADMADLVTYLRSVPPCGTDWPRIRKGPRFLKAEAAGRARPESLTLAEDLRHPPSDLGAAHARGRYLARTACAGCHQASLRGPASPEPGDAPGLQVVSAYDLPAFRTLLRTGKAVGGREVGLMSTEARKRFASLGDADVAALHGYLVRWAAQADAAQAPPPAKDAAR